MFDRLVADLRKKAEVYELPHTRGALARMLLTDGGLAQVLFRSMSFCQRHRMKVLAAVFYRLNGFLTGATSAAARFSGWPTASRTRRSFCLCSCATPRAFCSKPRPCST